MSSPTQRSLKKLRRDGWWVPEVCEYWNAFTKRRHDLWGFADLIAFNDNTVILVQTTSDANVAHRVAKIKEIPAARYWLESPTRRIVVHGWGKKGERGKPKRWECREVELTSDALGPIVALVPKRRQKRIDAKELPLFAGQGLPSVTT